jgi:hypothetical protein
MAYVQFSCINLNGRIDMNFISHGNPLLFYTGALSGIGVLWCLTRLAPEINICKRIANASMLIFLIHRTLYSVLTALFLIVLSDIQSLNTSATGSIVYATGAVLFGVLTLGYWKKHTPWMFGNR